MIELIIKGNENNNIYLALYCLQKFLCKLLTFIQKLVIITINFNNGGKRNVCHYRKITHKDLAKFLCCYII